MKVIVYTGDNGNAYVLTPVYPSDPLTPEGEAELLQRLQANDVPKMPDGSARPSFIKEQDSEEIYRMGKLFESWRMDSTGRIYWDAASGREIRKNEFRGMRKPLLEALDVAFMRALETGDTAQVAEISAQKKALRDVTLIDLTPYDTPEKLSSFIPEALK